MIVVGKLLTILANQPGETIRDQFGSVKSGGEIHPLRLSRVCLLSS